MNPPASISDREAAGERKKDLSYWRERGGQIEWRLAKAKAEVQEMEKDLKECDEMIKAALAHRDAQIEGLVLAFEKVIAKFSITHLEPDSIAEYRQALSQFESRK